MKSLGEAIRFLRNTEKLSLTVLAERAKIDASYLSLIERDLRRPTQETLRSIAEAMDVPPEFLTEFEVEGSRSPSRGELFDVFEEFARVKARLENVISEFRSGKAAS